MQKLDLTEDMTPIGIVRYYYEELTDEECEEILWGWTVYPFGSLEWIGEEVWDYYINNR